MKANPLLVLIEADFFKESQQMCGLRVQLVKRYNALIEKKWRGGAGLDLGRK